jgi:hypothetical protein
MEVVGFPRVFSRVKGAKVTVGVVLAVCLGPIKNNVIFGLYW